MRRIYRYQFKCNYPKNQKYFAAFFASLESSLNLQRFEKRKMSLIAEVIDSEKRASLNA